MYLDEVNHKRLLNNKCKQNNACKFWNNYVQNARSYYSFWNHLYAKSKVYFILWSYYAKIIYASTFSFIYIDILKNIMRLSDKRFAKCSYAFSRWYWCVSTYVFPVIDDNQLTTLRFAYTIITTIIRNADMIISKQ